MLMMKETTWMGAFRRPRMNTTAARRERWTKAIQAIPSVTTASSEGISSGAWCSPINSTARLEMIQEERKIREMCWATRLPEV
jgi:hypothetical protein